MATSDQIIEQLSNDKLDLEATKNATMNVLSEFMEKKELAVNSVRDHKAELVTELSKLEKESMRQIDEEYGNTERNLQNAIKEAEGNINELVQFQEKLEFLNEIKVQSCLAIKMAQKAIAKAKNSKELLQELSDVKVQTFHGEFKLKNYIQQTKSLGHLCVEEEVKELYTVNEQRDVDIKISTDKKTCRIFGTCLTDNGCLLLADCNNKNIKRIDVTTEKVTDHLCLEAAPNAVCQTSKDEAAVSLSNNNIQFISLANEMTATRSLEMDHYCSGLAYNDGELFMTNGSSTICTLDRENTYIQKRLTGKSGESVFSKTRHMCLSTNKDFMYVADMDKGLIALDKQGSYVSSFNDPDLIDARAVCTDGKGTMFACGFKSPCIIQIREDSKRKLGILKSKPEHLSICFDPNQNRLYVTYDGCDSIEVFDLK